MDKANSNARRPRRRGSDTENGLKDRGRLEDDPPVGHAIRDIGGESSLVSRLADVQLNKLLANSHKLHWLDSTVTDEYLVQRLLEEIDELVASSGRDAWGEAADVASLAAMIADRREKGAR